MRRYKGVRLASQFLISIIVPVYNKERVVEHCLQSILRQAYRNYEVILVDDGSTDQSAEICDRYAQADKRFRVYHRQNQGAGAARNFGIQQARGEYLMFVDADDSIAKDCLETLMDHSEGGQSDFVIGNFEIVTSDNEHISSNIKILSKSGSIYEDYDDFGLLFYTPWGKLYRTSIIKKYHISFPTDMYTAEDQIFNYQYYDRVSAYRYTEKIVYRYTCGDATSLSSLKTERTYRDEVANLHQRKKFCIDHSVRKSGKIMLQQVVFVVTKYHVLAKGKDFAQFLIAGYKGRNIKERIKIFLIRHRQYRILKFLCKS